MQMLYDNGGEEMEAELISICINLAANKRNALLMCEGKSCLAGTCHLLCLETAFRGETMCVGFNSGFWKETD